MCVKNCDCNNCYKIHTCTDCKHCKYQSSKVDCMRNGIKGCPYKVPYPKKSFGGLNESLGQLAGKENK